MNHDDFDPDIADAIVRGRLLAIPTLRGMAEFGGVILDDVLWRSMEPRWIEHNKLSSTELQKLAGRFDRYKGNNVDHP